MMPAHGMPPTSVIARMRHLRDSRDGTVAMMFGLLLLPTLVAIGVGVDVARAYSAKVRFDAAFDNAALALRASAASETAATPGDAARWRRRWWRQLGRAASAPDAARRAPRPLAQARLQTRLMRLRVRACR